MTAPVAQSTLIIESQAAAASGLSNQAQQAVADYFVQQIGDAAGWYDTDRITGAAQAGARVLDAYGVTAARFMDGFIADSVAFMTGKAFRPTGVRNTGGLNGERGTRTGVTTAGVLGRAADRYRYQQSLWDQQFLDDVKFRAASPTDLALPEDVARDRLKRGAQSTVALAGRNQAHSTLLVADARGRITGYRRVLHAELSNEGSCGLCVASSTRVYRAGDLMPMHPGCHCIPVPIAGDRDPGAAINDRDLGRFYADAGGTDREKLLATRYKVDEHGELGPVLRPHGDPIRTQAQAQADTNRRRPAKSTAEKVKTLRNRRDSLARTYSRVTPEMAAEPGWARRLDEVADRIARLDRQIVEVGG